MKKTAYSLAFALIFMSQSALSSTYYYLGCGTKDNDVQFAKSPLETTFTQKGFVENYLGSTYIKYQWLGKVSLFVVDYDFANEQEAVKFCLSLVKQCKNDGGEYYTGSFAAYGGSSYVKEIYVKIHSTSSASDDSYKSCEYLAGSGAAKSGQ